jgi:hypothetical protein
MKSYIYQKYLSTPLSGAGGFFKNKMNEKAKLCIWVLILLITHLSSLTTPLYAQSCTPTPSVMAKWDFSGTVQCNGAIQNPRADN